MILRARIPALLAIPLTFLASSHSFAQEKTVTKQDVEKRVKGAQKPQAAAPPRRISAGVADSLHAEGSVAWSPDSQEIAFLSDAAKKGQLQLYVTNAAGGAARMLTNVKGFLSTPGWSPDGKTITLLFTENATRASGPLVAETPETGEIKDAFF